MTSGPTIIILRVDPADKLAYARYAALLSRIVMLAYAELE